MMTLEKLRLHRREILDLAGKYGARNLRVFGSVARGDNQSNSDVDVLADFENGRSYFDLVGFADALESLLKCRVDVLTDGGISPHIERFVRRDAVLL